MRLSSPPLPHLIQRAGARYVKPFFCCLCGRGEAQKVIQLWVTPLFFCGCCCAVERHPLQFPCIPIQTHEQRSLLSIHLSTCLYGWMWVCMCLSSPLIVLFFVVVVSLGLLYDSLHSIPFSFFFLKLFSNYRPCFDTSIPPPSLAPKSCLISGETNEEKKR